MKNNILVAGAMAIVAATAAFGQNRAAADDPAAIRAGAALFRERCSECHGADAKGVPGHDLTRLWAAGATDERVFQTIRQGVPNTIMPSSSAPDDELRALVTYIRDLNGAGTIGVAGRNSQNGEQVFRSMCARCHSVDGRGGPLGPGLSRIAQSQSRELLTRAIREPDASMPDGYRPVTIITRDGRRIRGTRKSEDAFSIQMMDSNGQLRGFLKSGVRDIVRETTSLMPAFGPDRLTDSDLADVIAYLGDSRK
jgi:putative heme-binding domain-containing protein